MYILLYLEFYAPTFTSAKILRAAELFPSSSDARITHYLFMQGSECYSRLPHNPYL